MHSNDLSLLLKKASCSKFDCFLGHGSVVRAIGRYRMTHRKGSKIIEPGKQSTDHVHRKRAYGPRMVINESSRRREMNSQRGRPVKSYDFYDQPNDFEWFKNQGHNRYPFHGGVPNYSHEGYESYEKAPDPNDIAQAMTVLEKHMSSSEALGSDNMFRNTGGERYEYHNEHKPMGSNDESGLNENESEHNKNAFSFGSSLNDKHGGRDGNEEDSHQIAMNDYHNQIRGDGYGKGKENHFQFNQNGENPGHDKEQGQVMEGSHQAISHVGDDMQRNKEWFKNQHDFDKSGQGEKEDSNHESQESNHESQESNPASYESNQKSYANNDGNYEKMNDAKSCDPNGGPEMRSHYNEKDRSVLSGNYFEHDDASSKHNDYDGKDYGRENEGRASKGLQSNEQNEEYVDFPKKNDNYNNNNMNEINNRNNMVETSTSANSPPPLYQAKHWENPADDQMQQQQQQQQQISLNRNSAYQSDGKHENAEEIIKIDVGFPQYHLPNAQLEANRHEPHQGPERGGGLWGDLPGSGEQISKENKDDNGIKASAEVSRTDERSGSNEPGRNVKKISVGEVPEGNDGTYVGKEESNNLNGGKQNSGKTAKITKIPLTIRTGVYDFREIFSIDGKKRFISSRPKKKKSNSGSYAHKITLHSSGASKENEKNRKLKSKHFANGKKRNSKKVKHARTKKGFFVPFSIQEAISPSRYSKKARMQHWNKFEIRFHSDKPNDGNAVSTRHDIGYDLGAVHGFPAVSDEEALHSSPNELLDMANSYRHRAEEYDSKAKELENQAEIQDHQHNYHGAISQHHPYHQGPERGGDANNVEGEHHVQHHRFGPMQAPSMHGPGLLGASHFGHEHGEAGNYNHCDNVIHFNTGYPYYHVPRHQPLPLIEYHKPIPPVHGLNPYEVLTSEQFNRPHLPAGHGNLPYGHYHRTLHANPEASRAMHERSDIKEWDKDEPSTVLQLPKYEKNI